MRIRKGEGGVPFADVFKAGKRRDRLARFESITTFVWAGAGHTLLLGTSTVHGFGLVYGWNGETWPKTLYEPWIVDGAYNFQTRILSVNVRTGTVSVRASQLPPNGEGFYHRSTRFVRLRLVKRRHSRWEPIEMSHYLRSP